MNPFISSLILAAASALILQFSLIALSYVQRDFRGLMWKQLRHSFGLTFLRMLKNIYYHLFFLGVIGSAISGFFMMWYAVDTSGIVIITPFLIFILLFALTTPVTEKFSIPLEKMRRDISGTPTLKISSTRLNEEHQIFERAFKEVYRLLELNLSEPIGLIKSRFATPGPKYPSAYLWDSAFISGIWRVWDNKIAQDIMKPFLDTQLEDGFCTQTIPLGLTINKNITNPPLIAWAFCESASMTGDFTFLRQYYDRLKKFNEYLYSERKNGELFCWKHSYESGIDNSPRFTDRSESEHYDIKNLWAVDLNSWIMLHHESMIKIAEALGYREDVDEFRARNEALKKSINRYLWNEEAGYYFDYNLNDKCQIKIPTIVSFFPMLVGCTDRAKDEMLMQHIRAEDEFGTLVPFPSVSRNHETFLKDMWRGPVWMNTAYAGIQSLKKIGEDSLASHLSYRLFKAVAYTHENCGSIYEFYDVDRYDLEELSRKKGNFWKQVTLGSKPVKKFVGWTGLVNTMLIENVLGYRRRGGKTSVFPHLPDSFRNATVTLTVPQFKETLELSYKGEIIEGKLTGPDGDVREFSGNNHQKMI